MTPSSNAERSNKDAQQYWCKTCGTYFNDLTNTIFWQHRFELEEMFYIVKEMRSEPTVQIARDLDRDYEVVLNFVHKIQDASGDIDEFDLYSVCEADEVYVTAGEKGLEDEDGSPRKHGLKKGTQIGDAHIGSSRFYFRALAFAPDFDGCSNSNSSPVRTKRALTRVSALSVALSTYSAESYRLGSAAQRPDSGQAAVGP